MTDLINYNEIDNDLTDFCLKVDRGLPDSSICDDPSSENPIIDSEALYRYMGIPADMRRFDKNQKDNNAKMIFFLGSALMRFHLFMCDMYDFNEAMKGRKKISNATRSWDVAVFRKIDLKWHRPTGPFLTRYDSLSDDDIKTLRVNFENTMTSWMKKPVLSSPLKNKLSGYANSPLCFKTVAGMAGVVFDRINSWASLREEDKSLTADLAFSCTSFFGVHIIQLFITKQPKLLDYYKIILSETKRKEAEPNKATDNPSLTVLENNSAAIRHNISSDPYSLSDLYSEISNIAAKAVNDANSFFYADQIEALIKEKLPLIRANLRLSEGEVMEIITQCAKAIEGIGKSFGLPDFDDDTFIDAFRASWVSHFNVVFQAACVPNILESEVLSRYSAVECSREKRNNVIHARSNIDEKISLLSDRLGRSSFKERKEIRTALAEAEEERARYLRECHSVESDITSMLLPSGVTIEELPDAAEISIQSDLYHTSAFSALKSWDLNYVNEKIHKGGVKVACADNLQDSGQSHTDSPEHDARPVIEQKVDDAPAFIESAHSPADESEVSIDGSLYLAETASSQTNNAVVDAAIDSSVVSDGENAKKPIDEECDKDANGHNNQKITRYLADKIQATERLDNCLKTLGLLPAIVADNIALLWIRDNNLPMAFKTLDAATEITTEGHTLPRNIVSAAYQGMHVWRGNSSTLSRVLQYMNEIPAERIDELLGRKPGGKIVAYLLFSATFQPTMFAGNMSNAPRLLSQIALNFETPIEKMIHDLVAFTDHNHRLDIDSLREMPKLDEKENKKKISLRIIDWHDRIQNKQTGWAPARKGMKACLDREDFSSVYQAIVKDDVSKIEAVVDFANKYKSLHEQNELMHASVLSLPGSTDTAQQIAGNAKNWFLGRIEDVVEIAEEWVEASSNQNQRNTEVGKFAKKFTVMLSQAVTHVHARLDAAEDLEQKAGLRILFETLSRISLVASGYQAPLWSESRISGWLGYPEDWLSFVDEDSFDNVSQIKRISGLLADGFHYEQLIEQAIQKRRFDVALLLTQQQQDETQIPDADRIESIKKMFADDLHACSNRITKLRGMLDNAYVASLILDNEHYKLGSELEHIHDRLTSTSSPENIADVHSGIDEIQTYVESKFASKISALTSDMDQCVTEARVSHGADWVPSGWIDQIKLALASMDTTVAEEMIEHLKTSIEKNERLVASGEDISRPIDKFIAAEPTLYKALREINNPRDVSRAFSSESIPSLSLENISGVFKRALESLIGLRRRVRTLDKDTYEDIVTILNAIGFTASIQSYSSALQAKCNFNCHGKFCSMAVLVKRSDTSRGIVFFNESTEDQNINVILATGDWTVAELRQYMVEQGQAAHDRTILISSSMLSSDQRNDFAALCKHDKHGIYLTDMVILSALAGMSLDESNRLKLFLQLSLPWTYANPYTGTNMQPALREMRYGRQDDIRNLTMMRNGAAMVFGGRQLGKTTLLKETCRLSHKPEEHHFAYMKQMDGNLDRAKLADDELERHRKTVWRTIYNCAAESNMVREPTSGMDADKMQELLKEYFSKPNPDTLLVCLDEIDPILGLDAAHGFPIFRGISALVNDSKGSFKIIIAGLENVRRFADAPNYPLHQLGRAIQVSIMSPSEALHLIREPLGYLGYTFDSPLLINRVLVETNRHPGLIHIFCHELIKLLSTRARSRVGSIKITEDDIEKIRRNPEIRQVICDRFDITLNLDPRYKLIAYSLIGEGQTSFTPARAKAIVENWAPEIFAKMMPAQFVAYLDELRGLGVLQFMRRPDGGAEYALRNANILNLVGGRQDVDNNLLKALEAINDNDPSEGHAFPDKAERPSVLTLRDEKMLISDDSANSFSGGLVTAVSSKYSVGIIAGSEALGLNYNWIEKSLIPIGEEEPPINGMASVRYVPHFKRDTDITSADEFKRMLVSGIMGVQCIKKPIMFFVEITGDKHVSSTLDLLDVAHDARFHINPQGQRVRVIFLMTPKALWQWESSQSLTKGREFQQAFIALDVWRKTAIAHLLNKLNFENTSTSIDMLMEYSQGWYMSLDILMSAKHKYEEKKKRPGASDGIRVDALTPFYSPLLLADQKSFEKFLQKTGIYDVDWALSVLSAICAANESGQFDEDDIACLLLDVSPETQSSDALRWLSRLRLVNPVNNKGKTQLYCVSLSIKTALLAKSQSENKAQA